MIISPYHGLLEDIRNKFSSTIASSDVASLDDDGRSQSNSVNTRAFFDLDFLNSKSNSCGIAIHFEYFPPEQLQSFFELPLHIVGVGVSVGGIGFFYQLVFSFVFVVNGVHSVRF